MRCYCEGYEVLKVHLWTQRVNALHALHDLPGWAVERYDGIDEAEHEIRTRFPPFGEQVPFEAIRPRVHPVAEGTLSPRRTSVHTRLMAVQLLRRVEPCPTVAAVIATAVPLVAAFRQ